MNLQWLEEYRVLADCLNFSEASRRLFINQSALSRHIVALEAETGLHLLQRSTHGVTLTPAGVAFRETAGELLACYSGGVSRARDLERGGDGTLAVGYLGDAVEHFIPDFARFFAEAYPEIRLDIRAMELDDLQRLLADGALDAVFSLTFGGMIPRTVRHRRIQSTPMSVVMNRACPLAGQSAVALTELTGQTLWLLGGEYNQNAFRYITHLFEERGLKLEDRREVPNVETVMLMLQLNRGVFICPEHRSLRMTDDLLRVPLSDPNTEAAVELLWRAANRNPALECLLRAFDEFGQIPVPLTGAAAGRE